MAGPNRTTVGLKGGGTWESFEAKAGPNRTTVGLKGTPRAATSRIKAGPNRTTVGLKGRYQLGEPAGAWVSQSHHSGIERGVLGFLRKRKKKSQSHHSGIERATEDRLPRSAKVSQSHHSGIERRLLPQLVPGIPHVPIAPQWD